MKKISKQIFVSFFIVSIVSIFGITNTNACTDIQLNYKNQYIIGHNFDWPAKDAYFVINPAGIKRQSVNLVNSTTPALQWVSKYGSVIIDLADKNKQVSTTGVTGINQYGLNASILWLDDAKYPTITKKPVIGTSQWVQYFLDNAKTVAEAILLSKKIDIESTNYQDHPALVHLIIHDAAGNSAVMEYINGKLVIHEGKDFPVPVLTNDPYSDSIDSIKKYKNFGEDVSLPGGHYSPTRFVLATYFIKTLPPITSNQQAIANAFVALGYVSQPPGTNWLTGWSIVYDLSNKIIYYRDVDNQQIRTINLSDFNFSKDEPVKVLFLNNSYSGDMKNYFKIINANNNDNRKNPP